MRKMEKVILNPPFDATAECERLQGLFFKQHIVKWFSRRKPISKRQAIKALLEIANLIYGEERWVL